MISDPPSPRLRRTGRLSVIGFHENPFSRKSCRSCLKPFLSLQLNLLRLPRHHAAGVTPRNDNQKPGSVSLRRVSLAQGRRVRFYRSPITDHRLPALTAHTHSTRCACSGCVPYRTRISPFLCRYGRALGDRNSETESLDGGPSRCRDLDHARVVERLLYGVKIWIGPDRP